MKNAISFKALLLFAITCSSVDLLAENAEEGKQAAVESNTLTARFPIRIIDRGIVPTGIFNIDTNASMEGLKTIGLNIASQFGIVKKLEGQFGYDGAKVSLGAKYNYLSIPHLSASIQAGLPVHFLDDKILREVSLGLPLVFYNDIMAGSILGGELFTFKMRPEVETVFALPFWYGVQVYGNFWTAIDSSFGEIKMSKANKNTWETAFFWQKLPANLAVVYAFNPYVDLGANFGFKDTFEAKESIKFGLTLSARGGRLFG
jgi:hypothetical protein